MPFSEKLCGKTHKERKNGFFCGKRARFFTWSVEKVENSVEMLKNAVESCFDCSAPFPLILNVRTDMGFITCEI